MSLKKKFYKFKKNNKKGSHMCRIDFFLKLINEEDKIYFSEKINFLKIQRIKADYKNEIISKDISEKCLSLSKKINNLLIKNFGQ